MLDGLDHPVAASSAFELRVGFLFDALVVCDLIGHEILRVRLLAAVDHIFWEMQAADRRTTDDGMMAGRRVRNLQRRELKETFAQRDSTQQQRSMALIATFVLMDVTSASTCTENGKE